jgi:hypothetical protein
MIVGESPINPKQQSIYTLSNQDRTGYQSQNRQGARTHAIPQSLLLRADEVIQ